MLDKHKAAERTTYCKRVDILDLKIVTGKTMDSRKISRGSYISPSRLGSQIDHDSGEQLITCQKYRRQRTSIPYGTICSSANFHK